MATASRINAAPRTITQSRLLQLGFAALLGMFIVGFVGFAHIDAVHNAGHDYRHSMAFPCH
ncbi:MAG: CbtB domain-containing protein [Rhizobiaceae bacterium]